MKEKCFSWKLEKFVWESKSVKFCPGLKLPSRVKNKLRCSVLCHLITDVVLFLVSTLLRVPLVE